MSEPLQPPLPELLELLDDRFGVVALWVFGSEAQGTAGPASDLDVAVLFESKPDPAAFLETRAEATVLWDRPVDLVDVEQASPILAFQVLKNGRLLVDRDPTRRHLFMASVPSRREDLLIVRRPIEEAMLRSFREGTP